MSIVRRVETDAGLEAYIDVWNAITPDEPASFEQQRDRLRRDGRRLHLLAELEGAVVGACFAGPSDTPDRGFLAPRVLPEARRRGLGSALLHDGTAHLESLGFRSASSHVDGGDNGSLAFAARHGFEEVDRQVEQVKLVGAMEPGAVPDGLTFVSLEERPELLCATHPLAVEGYADMATFAPVTISLDDWLADEGTLPGGSVVALDGDEIVGYSGLCRLSEPGLAEDGLTVVRRSWRRRGLADALKRTKLAWAADNGISEIVTWTQRGNEAMRALNERLGYTYRSVSISVRAPP